MKQNNIGIITKPIANAGITPLSNLVEILCDIYPQTYLITSYNGFNLKIDEKNLKLINLNYKMDVNPILKFLKYVFIQFEIVYKMLKTKNVNTWIFFFEANVLLLPLIISKIISNNTIILLGASLKHTGNTNKDIIIRFSIIPEKWSYKIADKLVVYSPNLIKYWNLEKYDNKIIIAHRHFLNFKKFKVTKNLNERKYLVGYIGRLTEEKGIKNFLEAINIIFNNNDNIKCLIGGDGTYKDKMEKFVKRNGLCDSINYVGWISQDELPNFLNEIKLLIIPSYTEGLPNVMLESMACGTPVLANSVGAIPDVITDGFNGFLMENNSSKNIAKSILSSINNENMEKVAFNANKTVKNNFNKENVIKNWKKIL